MKSKVILQRKGGKDSSILENTENEIDKYLNEGYKVVSSQMIFEGIFLYTYTVMVKD